MALPPDPKVPEEDFKESIEQTFTRKRSSGIHATVKEFNVWLVSIFQVLISQKQVFIRFLRNFLSCFFVFLLSLY